MIWQPTLQNDLVTLRPLAEADFEPLRQVASDPLIWAQHPAKERATPDGFAHFFSQTLMAGGTLVIIDNATGQLIGCSRYAPVPETDRAIEIGWTFMARAHWGGRYNRAVKALMIAHALQHVEVVLFYIHEANVRSQRAMEKIGGQRITELDGLPLGLRPGVHMIYALRA
jgi:N-acetyltransferase